MTDKTDDGFGERASTEWSVTVDSGADAAVYTATPHGSETTPVTDGGTGEVGSQGTLGPNQQYCNSCGSVIAEDAAMCPDCGVSLEDTEDGEEPSGRWKAAIIGGVASFFLGWIPLVGPAIGGAIAGYLRGSDTKESAITGTIANVLASIPSMLLVVLFFVLGIVGAGSDPTMGGGEVVAGLLVWLIIFAVGFVYFWALGAIGGVVGASITDRRGPS